MSDMKKIMSGLLKATVGMVVSNIGADLKEKIEDKIENVEDVIDEIKGESKELTTAEMLSSRLTADSDYILTSMDEEEFRTRMSSIGYNVSELAMPQEMEFRAFLANRGKFAVSYKIWNESERAKWEYNFMCEQYRKDGRKILAEELGCRILSQTADSLVLLSRIENSLLSMVLCLEDEEETMKIINAFQGTAY